MSVALPDHIDPWRAAKSGLSFAGERPLADFPRLLAVGIGQEGESSVRVAYQLDFSRDGAGRPCLDGWVHLRLCVLCQRCLSALWLDLHARPRLVLVRSESAASAVESADYEVLVVTDDSLALLELIEDELLLAIPPFPRHLAGECRMPGPLDAASAPSAGSETVASHTLSDADKSSHPFAILERLKTPSR